jgi:NAD dependent epimerase/dehydratase
LSVVAVTGAGGFIGSHLVERLLTDGHDVRALVRYVSTSSIGFLGPAREAWPERLRIDAGTVEDPGCLRDLLDSVDVVFHLAALGGIPYSYVAPHHYVQTNVIGTLNVLEAARALGVGRMVSVSTSETYGTAQFVPITESHPVHAQSPYAATKASADQLVLSYQRSFGTPVVVVRPFNTFGPRQSARAVIPAIVTQALTGDVVRLGSVAPRRDLTYVSDTVNGMVLAGFAPGVEGEEINLGTGVSWAVGDIAAMVIERVNPGARIEVDPARLRPDASEVMELVAGIDKARRLLGFEPTVPFARGLELVIDEIRGNLDRFRVGEYLV